MKLLAVLLLTGCVVDDPTFDTSEKPGPGPGGPGPQSPPVKPTPPPTLGAPQPDAFGSGQTLFMNGPADPMNPFFASLGTNGRSCGSCHAESAGFSITPAGVQAKFNQTQGLDPIFRTNDGSVSPTADVSTVTARKAAYAMLLNHGLIRIGLPVPANADFTLVAVDDPYGHASAADLSLFRRPLPSTSLTFIPAVMWDGRESSLGSQAIDATLGHAQATGTNQSQMDAIVAFESSIYSAQTKDKVAGDLIAVQDQLFDPSSFYIGINDPLGHDPKGIGFDEHVFSVFDGWSGEHKNDPASKAKQSIYRGQQIFNSRKFQITGVKGLNDLVGSDSITGTCTLCHDTPNVGNHSFPIALNLGLTDESRRAADMPLYTFQNNATGEQVKTTDPGRALVTGKFADIGKFKGPILRGLAMRAPYFHNGFAATLNDAVDFYDDRFDIGLTAQDKTDLVAFLQAL